MADPLSTAASIVGIISLVIEITKLVCQFQKDWKDAPENAKIFMEEIQTLRTILSVTHTSIIADPDFAAAFQNRPSLLLSELGSVSPPNTNTKSMIEVCRKKLESLLKELAKKEQGHRLGWERLKGAFSVRDTREAVRNLCRQCQTLNNMLSIDGIGIAISTNKEIKEIRQEQQERYQYEQNKERRHEEQVMLDWLTPIDYAQHQNDFNGRRQEGTGQWLLDSKAFKNWLNTDQKTLFCPGIPGAGKTTLTALVVEELEKRFSERPDVGIAYIYCNFRREHEQKIHDLLASLLKQLSEHSTSIPGTIIDLYNRHKEKRTRPLLKEILLSLRKVADSYSEVFIIIDALDECQMIDGCRSEFITNIFSLQNTNGARLFVTSRPLTAIEKMFEGYPWQDIVAKDEDIKAYLDGKMSRLPKCVLKSTELQEDIKIRIAKSAQGMFLLAELYLNSLQDKLTVKSMRTALRDFQTKDHVSSDSSKRDLLSLAYKDAMQRINEQTRGFKQLAFKVLSWIICALRPLTTIELQHAVAVEIDEPELDGENIPEVEDMVSVCAGLVTVDHESNIIRLVHYTTQEYFNQTQSFWFPDADSEIAMICVTYLSFSTFDTGACYLKSKYDKKLKENIFYIYAAENWGHHARKANALIQTNKTLLGFLESKTKVAGASQAVRGDIFHSEVSVRGVNGLHLTAHFDLQDATTELLARECEIDACDLYKSTPLMWALTNGNVTVAQVLINHGADIETRDSFGQTPLHVAINNGQLAAVEYLLSAGADLNAFDKRRQGALHLAIQSGCHSSEMTKLLLMHDTPVDMADVDNMTPLHRTVQYGYTDISRQLLQKGVPIDIGICRKKWEQSSHNEYVLYETDEMNVPHERYNCNIEGLTPLHFAALAADEEMTRFCLGVGANPNARSHHGKTPLHLVLSADIDDIDDWRYTDSWSRMRWSVQDIWNPKDEEGREQERRRIVNMRKSVVRILLDDDRTDIKLQDIRGSSILHAMDFNELDPTDSIIQTLVQRGADLSARNLKGQTALHLACKTGEIKSIRTLIASGASTLDIDYEGRTILHFLAASNDQQTLVTFLESNEEDLPTALAVKDHNGRNLLHCSMETIPRRTFVQWLLNHGVSAVDTDELGNSALAHYLIHRNNKDPDICKLLLENGDNGNYINKAGETLAELYVTHAPVKVDILKLFREYKVDLNRTNVKGMNLLHTMVLNGNLTAKAFYFVLKHTQVHPNTTDFLGRTPLQIAIEKAEKSHSGSQRWVEAAEILSWYNA